MRMVLCFLLFFAPTVIAGISRGDLRVETEFHKQDQPPTLKFKAPDERPVHHFRSLRRIVTTSWYQDKQVNHFTSVHDGDGFRVMPLGTKEGKKERHLILEGCSWTFGSGVEDNEPFPSLLALRRPQDEVHNFGVFGSGPNEHNFLWRYADFHSRVHTEAGFLIFMYMPFQHERFQRVPRYYDWAAEDVPRFAMKDGKLEYQGTNGDDWLFKVTRFFKALGLSTYWLRFYSWFEKYHLQHTHREMAEHLRQLKASYLRQFPKGRFYVFHGGLGTEMNHELDKSNFRDELAKAGVDVLELGQVPQDGELLIPIDGHPNKRYHQWLAERLDEEVSELIRSEAPQR